MQLVGSSICIHEHSLDTVPVLTLSLFVRKNKWEVKRWGLKEEGIEKGCRETIVAVSFHYNTILVKMIEKQYGFEHEWGATREIELVYLMYRYDYLQDIWLTLSFIQRCPRFVAAVGYTLEVVRKILI